MLKLSKELALEVQSTNCFEKAGKCVVEAFGKEIGGSKDDWKAYFEFLERHSVWRFGILLGGELTEREKDFLRNVRFLHPTRSVYNMFHENPRSLLLIRDAITEDFKNDFHEYYSSVLEIYSSLLEEYGADIRNWAFSGYSLERPYKTGAYVIVPYYDFDFNNLADIKLLTVQFRVEFVEELEDSSNPFLFIPFDGEIGLKNGREGYGVSIAYSGKEPIYLTMRK